MKGYRLCGLWVNLIQPAEPHLGLIAEGAEAADGVRRGVGGERGGGVFVLGVLIGVFVFVSVFVKLLDSFSFLVLVLVFVNVDKGRTPCSHVFARFLTWRLNCCNSRGRFSGSNDIKTTEMRR